MKVLQFLEIKVSNITVAVRSGSARSLRLEGEPEGLTLTVRVPTLKIKNHEKSCLKTRANRRSVIR